MKINVSELSGAQLDYAVALADGRQAEIIDQGDNPVSPRFYVALQPTGAVWWPSTHWAQGGPIIERERIQLEFHEWHKAAPWCALQHGNSPADDERGPTPLVAAMRAYVASKFGEEVEVPA